MDLRCRLEHNEKDWLREKAELLERFNVERREWESQLKDMQKKIEELYCEVRTKRGGPGRDSGRQEDDDIVNRLSIRSTSTGSSLLSDSSQSEPNRNPPVPGFSRNRNISGDGVCRNRDSQQSSCFQADGFSEFNALKEIARVSEELCSYQDEIRKKNKTYREADEAPCDLSQIYNDLRALGRENWITLSPDNTWQASRGSSDTWTGNSADPESYRGEQMSPGVHSEMDTAAPPIPPRTSSWNLSSHQETELHIPESPVTTARKCHSPCVLVDRKCSSPSIVRKFEAMLQENEGKVFIDGVVASCSVPANSNCNTGCCHNRWSCDASKFTSSKLSTYGTVQKSFSEVNILSAGKDLRSDYRPGVNLKTPELQMPSAVRELPVDLLLSSLEITPVSPKLQGSRRNIMLEQKTAEFNRTLFQAEMGRGVEEQNTCTVTDTCSVGFQPTLKASDEVLSPKENNFQLHCTDTSTEIKQRQTTQPRHASDSSRTVPRMMNDHPWKPLTLAAYPRPEGSRSNYGAVERILKNYESAARAQQNEAASSPNFNVGQEENVTELDMLDMDPLPLPEHDGPSVSSSSVQKNFSRPARPANRRLPSRWASRSPTSSSSTSSSPSV
uniref:MTCL family member 3a n=1 Tax=Amphiprion percula TaxID=161767 RepID=A0A3P8TI78_AMPPE